MSAPIPAAAAAAPDRQPARPHTRWAFAALFAVAGSVIVGIVVLAFVWPVATAKAQDLPVAVAGPTAARDAIATRLDDQAGGAITIVKLRDQAAAERAIRHREVYGAVIAPAQQGATPTVLIASASSAPATQIVRGIAQGLQTGLQQQVAAAGGDASTVQVRIRDLVPLSDDDATGSGLTAAAFPLVLGGVLGGVLISLLVVGVIRRLLALLVYGIAGGVLVALVLQTLFGILQGDFAITALAIGLAMLATAALIVGFTSLIGPRGIAIGSVITMLIGNPLAGGALPYQFLASPWGELGQYFVPGAAISLVRSLSYFPDGSTAGQWTTLGVWAGAGILLALVGHFRSRAPIPLPAAELEQEHEHVGRHEAVPEV